MLFVVATPIGNLEDITLRALRILGEVDLIVAEDTRQTKKLLDKYEIKTPIMSFNQYASDSKVEQLVDRMLKGEKIAAVSDAGTPAVSDPGAKLVSAARSAGITIVPIPGPSAVTALLSAAGLPESEFLFLGFLPKKKGRQTLWGEMANMEVPMVLFESPNRLLKLLKEVQEYMGERQMIIGRELTKIHEEIKTGTVSELIAHFTQKPPKGELVVIIR